MDIGAAIVDTADYFYKVTAVDGALETTASGEIGKCDFVLLPGWNLISLPVLNSETSIDSVIGSQLTGGNNFSTSDVIYYFDGSSYQSAWCYEPTQKWYGTLTDIESDKGYWVKILSGHTDTLLTFVGTVSDTSRKITVIPGWNMIGSSYPVEVVLSESNLAGSGLTGGPTFAQSDKIYEYGSSGYSSAWLYSVTSTWYGALTSLRPGKGYWIWVLDGHSGFTWDFTRQQPQAITVGVQPKVKQVYTEIESKDGEDKPEVPRKTRMMKSLSSEKEEMKKE